MDRSRSPINPSESLSGPAHGVTGNSLPVIAGLDTAAGLHRVAGRTALYLSLLRKFSIKQKSVASAIACALDSNDRGTAERLAHTVKGLAGTLGAHELQTLAGAVEEAVRNRAPRPTVDECLRAFASALAALISELEQNLPSAPSPVTDNPVDLRNLAPVCCQLARLLADDDLAAVQVLEENASLLWKGFPEEYRELEHALLNFEYGTAETVLEAACRKHGVGKEEL